MKAVLRRSSSRLLAWLAGRWLAVYWFNGQMQATDEITLAIADPGWLYGATTFTTLRVYERSLAHPLTQWARHCDRLRQAVQTLQWVAPEWERLAQGAIALLTAVEAPVLRVTLWPDGRELITARPLPPDLASRQTQGIAAWVATAPLYQRWCPDLKTGNYLGAWQALRSAQQQAAQEAILVDQQGHWVETATGNLWGWQQGQWWTPPVENHALAGVCRARILEWLNHCGQSVQEVPWEPTLVSGFLAIACSNAVVEVVPLHTILRNDQRDRLNPDHPCINQLRAAFQIESWQS